ncbi:MAG: hypothetical protein M1456_04930 [Actinobacteria bacterium]|nr:hypothetical protein [Actinomycetota bacterium]
MRSAPDWVLQSWQIADGTGWGCATCGMICGSSCSILCSMSRERISTTVDRDRLMACRRLLGTSDSKLFDQALVVLLDELEGDRERQALDVMPYHEDTDIAWEAPEAPSLPYDGEVPEDVQRLAAARRRRTGV